MASLTLSRGVGILAVLTLGLLGCGRPAPSDPTSGEATPPAAELNAVEAVEAESPAPIASPTSAEATPTTAMPPGQYCYQLDTADESGFVRLTVAADQTVSGDASVSIHNESAGYYSSYEQRLEGLMYGSQATIDATTWIEYDVQQNQYEWTVTPQVLNDGDHQIPAVDCAVARERFVGPNGLEAADLLSGATQVNTQRLQFELGESSAEVGGSVVRGDRDVYLLNAQGGQQMTVRITALENNAAFDIVDPSGLVLAVESTDETLLLPHTGDYQVIVGGTRGNANYALSVAIE